MPLSLRLPVACLFALMSSVSAAQSSGTAFVVAPGLLVTNHHVIEDCGDIEIIAPDGKRPATIVDSVEQIDLALLRVYGLRGGAASLRTQGAAQLGEAATVFGFPLGGALSSTGNFTTGVVSSLRGLGDAAGEIQITAPVQPGNSGGPVLDRAGSVIGVVKSRLSHKYMLQATGGLPQNVNFAVSLDVLADFLAKNNVSFKAVDRQAAIETTQVAEMAQTFTYKISCTAASRTATAPRPQAPPPTAPLVPTPDKLVQDIQTALNQKGFNAGPADGFIGPQTQIAIRSAQKSLGLPVTGVPSDALLTSIKRMATAVLGSTMQDALAAYKDQDYRTAFKIWREFSQKGDLWAQNNLGNLYAQGKGVTQDHAEAVKWYKLAAAQGNAAAQNSLGHAWALGLGVVRDYFEAARWLKLASAQGHATAQSALGLMYEAGLGVAQDHNEAVKWYKLSASQGNAKAQLALGIAYAVGRGAIQDYAESAKWYRLAAAQGEATAQANLGYAYGLGQGVVKDYAEAVKWYRLAVAQGNSMAQYNLGALYQSASGVAQDYVEAVRLYRLAAIQGNVLSQLQLGVMHESGKGVKQDYAEAARWYKLATAQNNAQGKQRLDSRYSRGLISK